MRLTSLDAFVRPAPKCWTRKTFTDARGTFSPLVLDAPAEAVNVVVNPLARTLRGLHFQTHGHRQAKTLTVIRGAVFDVVVDLHGFAWWGSTLTAEVGEVLQIPEHFAHGYLTLAPDTWVVYAVRGAPYAPHAEDGFRWDDPAMAIAWPDTPQHLSDKDRAWRLIRDRPDRLGL